MKTNAMRLLDNHNMSYEILLYSLKKEDFDATQIAIENGIPAHLLFKTLVCIDENKQIKVAVLPSNEQLSTKKLEKASKSKEISLMAMDDLLGKTGYMRGGCSPLAMKRKFPVFFHDSVTSDEPIWVNAGKKGCLLKIGLKNLLFLTEGIMVDIVR